MSKRESSKSEQGAALLHAFVALGSKDLLQNSGFTSVLTWKILGRLQVWQWNAKINPLKERLNRALGQLLAGPPPHLLDVLYFCNSDVMVPHLFTTTTYPKERIPNLCRTPPWLYVQRLCVGEKGGVCVCVCVCKRERVLEFCGGTINCLIWLFTILISPIRKFCFRSIQSCALWLWSWIDVRL